MNGIAIFSWLNHLPFYACVTSSFIRLSMCVRLLPCLSCPNAAAVHAVFTPLAQSLLLSCKTESPRPLPLPTTLLSVSMEPTALGAFFEWTQASFFLPCLPYVTEHNAFRLHPRCRLCQNCLPFRLDNIHCVDGPWSACLFFCEGRVEYLHSSLMPCHICGIASESPRIQKSFTITYFVNFFILKSSKSQKKGRMYVSFTCICEQML